MYIIYNFKADYNFYQQPDPRYKNHSLSLKKNCSYKPNIKMTGRMFSGGIPQVVHSYRAQHYASENPDNMNICTYTFCP